MSAKEDWAGEGLGREENAPEEKGAREEEWRDGVGRAAECAVPSADAVIGSTRKPHRRGDISLHGITMPLASPCLGEAPGHSRGGTFHYRKRGMQRHC